MDLPELIVEIEAGEIFPPYHQNRVKLQKMSFNFSIMSAFCCYYLQEFRKTTLTCLLFHGKSQ
jgi:hypothetical protein